MKPKQLFFSLCFLLSAFIKAQISFVLTPSLCAEDSVYVIANTNSFPATSFSWSAIPAGAIISSPHTQGTYIHFTAGATYTVYLEGSASTTSAYANQTIQVHALPQLNVTASNATICPGQSATLTASGALNYTWTSTPSFINSFGGVAYVAPGTTETYTLEASNTPGCNSILLYTLVVGVQPYITALTNATAVCAGNTATILAYNANSFTWTGTNISSPITQSSVAVGPGTYSLVGSNGGSCNDTLITTIQMSAPLNLIISADRTVICKDGGDTLVAISLSANGADTYTWEPYLPGFMTFSLGANTAVSPSVSTCFTLTGYTPECTGQITQCIDVRLCTMIKDRNEEFQLQFFPNPVTDILKIRSEKSGLFFIEVIDLTGSCVLKEKLEFINNPELSIDLQRLSKGIYLLKVFQEDRLLKMERLIKE